MSDKNNGTVHEDQHTFIIILRSIIFKMRNISNERCRENRNTHSMFNHFFRKPFPFLDNVEKFCTAEQATDDTMTHAHWIQDT